MPASSATDVVVEAGKFADKKLQKLAEECKLSDKMIEWLVTQAADSIEKVAAACTEEKEVRATIIDAMNSSTAEMCKTIGDQAAVKLFWHRCRDVWLKAGKAEDASVPVGDCTIPEKEIKSMTHLWMQKHEYTLPDCHLLIASQQAKVWNDFDKENRELEHWFANKLRHRGEGNPRQTAHQFSMIPGKPVEAMQVVLDRVEDKIELWMRIRALLMTMAYVSTSEPAWSPLQLAVQTSEHILKLVTATFEKQRPPLEFMVSAWDNTVHSWSESIRMTRRSAAVVIGNFSMWEAKARTRRRAATPATTSQP